MLVLGEERDCIQFMRNRQDGLLLPSSLVVASPHRLSAFGTALCRCAIRCWLLI
jgi:hypothetical protein